MDCTLDLFSVLKNIHLDQLIDGRLLFCQHRGKLFQEGLYFPKEIFPPLTLSGPQHRRNHLESSSFEGGTRRILWTQTQELWGSWHLEGVQGPWIWEEKEPADKMWQRRVPRQGDPKFCPKYILKQDTHTGNHPLSGSCHKVHMCRELECHNCNFRPIPRCPPRASKVGRHIPQLRNLVGVKKYLVLFQTRARKILKHHVGLEKLELFCT